MKIVHNPRFLNLFFQNEIYAISNQKKETPSVEAPPKEYKLLLLAYREGEEAPFSDAEQAFLRKVLKAVSLKSEEVFPFNLAHPPQAQAWENMKIIPAPFVLVLGDTKQKSETGVFYQLEPYNNARRVWAHSLAHIEADREKKKKLWAILQAMFLNA